MTEFFKDYLWAHNIIVSNNKKAVKDEEMIASITLLASHYNVIIHNGKEYTDRDVYSYVYNKIQGRNIPEPFYKGFPMSILKLSKEELLIDQLYHYYNTYGMNNFDGESGHSIFEEEVIRTALKENGVPKYIDVLTEEEAIIKINEYFNDMIKSTRVLNTTQYDFILNCLFEYRFNIINISCKNTAIKLLVSTTDTYYCKYLTITDVPKIIEQIIYDKYQDEQTLKKLHLNSADRKFVSMIIRILLAKSTFKEFKECLEKKKIWCGLLHHIHYKPINDDERYFLNAMRTNELRSTLSDIESNIKSNNIIEAASIIKSEKGTNYLIRNLRYLISRCNSDDEVTTIVNMIDDKINPIVLMQLLLSDFNASPRTFSFVKNNLIKTHYETECEVSSRKSYLTPHQEDIIRKVLISKIYEYYKGKINGTVYVDDALKTIALPIYNSTGDTGFGILPTGSRIPITSNVIRAFTYWEKVNDIDLSIMGCSEDFSSVIEYSWRTIYRSQSDAITFSGDVTNGFKGGSEYFDINLSKFRALNPNTRYLIFANNVFSGNNFNTCYCTAGFMCRDDATKGNIYEPKTVKTSYRINGETTFTYLFAIDLVSNEMIWINFNNNLKATVAGTAICDWLKKFVNISEMFNYAQLFKNMATTLTIDSSKADIVVSDNSDLEIKEDATVIHSYDIEKVLGYMNS